MHRVKDLLNLSARKLKEQNASPTIYDNIIVSGTNSVSPGFIESLKSTVIPFAKQNVKKTKNANF